ncbi:MAG: bifunctional phosphoglucose/phosphomannose isomerase [Bacteroidota bacterium]
MTENEIQKYDSLNMRRLIAEFPNQVQEAVIIGRKFARPFSSASIRNIVVAGLGGSAIGGDILRAYSSAKLRIPFQVNRHYYLPEFVGERCLVIISSYSGNTEETLAVHEDAMKRKAKIVCISSDGEIARRSRKYKQPLITIPGGLPPRAALGYSFFPTLILMYKFGFIPSPEKAIKETISLLSKKSLIYGNAQGKNNPAFAIAKKLYGKLPIIYSAADRFDVVNLRWRGQISENAKVLAYGHVYPEMNHNELVGWSKSFHSGNTTTPQMDKMAIVYLRDKEDYKRIQMRIDITKPIIGKCASDIIEVHSEGTSLLARMFSLIYLGDWVSYYLAILNKVDPTPVKVIDFLKNELAKRK